MLKTELRFEVIVIDKKSLRTLMRFRGHSVRSLARAVKCSPATIGHLTNPNDVTRWTVNADTASRIAKVLDTPADILFEPRLSRVRREVARAA